ncbi:MAG: hypothetical protein FWD33_01485 [Alphaproteobacteria bacterium]|nr:hypothetical protein [Alphaproteobacteria bacterium]
MMLIVDCCDGTTVATDDGRFLRAGADNQAVMLPKLVSELGIDFKKISAIGAVVGPGSFTGIRIGIAWAKGAAIAAGVPVIPISRFEIALRKNPDAVIAIDNKKDGWFVQSKDFPARSIAETKQGMIINPNLDIDAAFEIMAAKKDSNEQVIPLYIKPHYAEEKC